MAAKPAKSGLGPRLDELARRQQRPIASVVTQAVEEYIEREEARLSFAAEAEASWRDYTETGRHLTGSEIARWLQSWGTEAEAPPPPCHG